MAEQTWSSLQQSCAIAMGRLPSPVPATPVYDALFLIQFPLAVSTAETRIYHEIPFIASYVEDSSTSTAAGSRDIDFSATALPLVTPEVLRLVVNNVLIPYDRVSIDFIDRVWPNQFSVMTPSLTWQGGRYWALRDAVSVIIAPTPDGAYSVKLGGLFGAQPMSVTNPSTYLSRQYPELLQAAICVFLAGALNRNYGAAADEAPQALSWETLFQKHLSAAKAEETRRRGMSTPPAPERVAA
jgi:hypothetical protein